MIYTCYEMIQDCRLDKPEGWSYFIRQYIPVMRRLLVHYFPEREADGELIRRVLVAMRARGTTLFEAPEPDRLFVARLRQAVLEAVESDRAGEAPEIPLDLETLTAALEPFTAIEKQMAWFETMRYDKFAAGRMLRADPTTVEKNRERAAELIRARVDAWRRTLLADNGAGLGREAAAQATQDCASAKTFLDILDGRANWSGREQTERHVSRCWHCVDHVCRLLEAADLLRGSQALSDADAVPFETILGIQAPKSSLLRKMFGG